MLTFTLSLAINIILSPGAAIGQDFSLGETFSDEEIRNTVAYWNSPSRYIAQAISEPAKRGVWQVRLTPGGSQWLWSYDRSRGVGKNPTIDSKPTNELEKGWQIWIDGRVAFDRYLAGETAKRANEKVLGKPWRNPEKEVEHPGPMPTALYNLVGNAPSFAEAAVPMQHLIRFEDGEIALEDNVPMRSKFTYFRFSQGVQLMGQKVKEIPEKDLETLLGLATISASEGRVFKAVSLLEGGFDSVNTYDTGYVSVGFIQFASLSGGSGSLGSVLLEMRRTTPASFQVDFRSYGIDVNGSGVLQILDPSSGILRQGPDGARIIIEDKRLIAVFHRAGSRSQAFKVAQLRTAKAQFYPAGDRVSLVINGTPMFGVVSDFIKSEAGMATLMDRKVNTGRMDPLIAVLTRIGTDKRITAISDLSKYELEIVNAMKYRKNYMDDKTLSQPVRS